ncbi:hypothetical protein CEXT_279581 [Caerostris extrusa]|uniref:Uncharacterized protein n=1 Tax=Caerostris extrusa TaxID=172846 RepID=A0AAV4X3X0_CAEEX|nr:hypothetical protein CEXT_279581 [Caerostris extrusa]
MHAHIWGLYSKSTKVDSSPRVYIKRVAYYKYGYQTLHAFKSEKGQRSLLFNGRSLPVSGECCTNGVIIPLLHPIESRDRIESRAGNDCVGLEQRSGGGSARSL